MAKSVLSSWSVKTTDDFGNIVFNLVNARLLSKTEEDTIEEFHDVYDFEKVFVRDYEIESGRSQKPRAKGRKPKRQRKNKS